MIQNLSTQILIINLNLDDIEVGYTKLKKVSKRVKDNDPKLKHPNLNYKSES